jgi:predicted MFS family arabinose efflux permease
MKKLLQRITNAPRELKLFLLSILIMSLATNMYDSTFNNYLNQRFALTGFQRSFLEIPRELPGFLCVFITAAFWFLDSRRLGVVAMVFSAIGSLFLWYLSPVYGILVIWLFLYSLGSHLFLPIQSVIGMELADPDKPGERLGQINSVRNLSSILGAFVIFVGFKYLHFTFEHSFILVAIGLVLAGVLLYGMKPEKNQHPATYLKLHKEYRLYYLLAILYGSRKQLFLTFAPWVLVTVYHQPTQVMATLFMIGGIIGIIFQPILGRAIDKLGEKTVLVAEGVLLVVVCFTYGFSNTLFSETTALWITFVCYLIDQMLMSVNMARATYMRKIAKTPDDIQPALTVAVTIDHVFSISIALIGGIIWNEFGYQYVFLMGVVIALIDIFTALKIKLPTQPGIPQPDGVSADMVNQDPA